jgi:peptidoglycan/LPS O-acetylase OafA/YrhL
VTAGSPSITLSDGEEADGRAAASSPSVGVGYRPHLDGIRTVAVYLVVAFHADVDRASGGFIGVDIFFVLSGYLVTQLLLREMGGSDRPPFRRFYARRAKRLLPAAAVNLVVTAAVFAVIAAPVELQDAVDSIRAAALYYVNWFFIAESADYFGSDVAASPVAHYWSLSIEEQYYLLWPVLLTGVGLLARRFGPARQAVTRGIVAGLALASLVWALVLATSDLNRAYYGTDARAYQLLAGALIALSPAVVARVAAHRAAARAAAVASLVTLTGLLALGTSLLDVAPVTRGALVTALAVGLIASVEASPGIARSVLSWTPFVYLGRISYGTYIWHWLVIIVIDRTYELSPIGTLAVAVPVATGLASLSYQLLEHPIRVAPLLNHHRNLVIAGALGLSALVGVVVAPAVLEDDGSSTDLALDPALIGGTPVARELVGEARRDRFDFDVCPPGRGVACTLVEGDGPKILVIGESHAGMFTPMLAEIAERHDAELSGGYLSYCPWIEGIRYTVTPHTATLKGCFGEQEKMFDETVPALDPDIVVLAHRSYDDPAELVNIFDVDEGRRRAGTEEATQAVRRRMTDLVQKLRADGRQVVIIEPVPIAPVDQDPVPCLSETEIAEACRFVTHVEPTPQERIMRELAAADDGVWTVDLDELACPWFPICDPVVEGEVVRSDNNHLTVTFATEVLTDAVDQFFVENGILRRT